jgi:hypothetical protein
VIPVRALVDTGASNTCIDPSVLIGQNPAGLALTPTGTVSMTTPSTGTTPHIADQYDVALLIPHATLTPLVRLTIAVASVELLAQGFHVLIGRDILKDCVLVYNGTEDLFILAY